MTQLLTLYGFGSFFRGEALSHDIDLVLLHEHLSSESIQFSIQCKRLIKAEIPRSHITMLSEQEEHDLEFLSQSKAEQLGVISATHMAVQIQQLSRRIAYLDSRSALKGRLSDKVIERIDKLWPELGLPSAGRKIWD